MRNVKSHSSGWIHETFAELGAFAWQQGYGVFTVSESQFEVVRRYIERQEEPHRVRTFEEEYEAMLKAHRVDFDRRYLWEPSSWN